jgi:hypothetical protein
MEVAMDWVLVLIVLVGNHPTVTSIPGHKSEAACLATLANAKRAAEKSFSVRPAAINDIFINSFCVEKGK